VDSVTGTRNYQISGMSGLITSWPYEPMTMNGWPSNASSMLVNKIRFAASILEDAELVGPKLVLLRIGDLALQLRGGLLKAARLRRLALRSSCIGHVAASWVAPLPRCLTEAKQSRQQAHADVQVLWLLGVVACRGLPLPRVGANGFGPPEQVGSPFLHRSVALPANRRFDSSYPSPSMWSTN
jgi:hypothetical protein